MEQYDVSRIEEFEGPYRVTENGMEQLTFTELADYFLDPQYDLIERDLGKKRDLKKRPKTLYGSAQPMFSSEPNEYEEKKIGEFRERRDETDAFMRVKDAGGWKRFDLNIRHDADPYSPATPFSIITADHDSSNARFGIRIARNYDTDLLELNDAMNSHLVRQNLPEQVDEESGYDPSMLEGFRYWAQEPELFAAADTPEGVNDEIIENWPMLDPITGRDYRVAELREDPRFDFADFEMAFLYNWGHDPYAGGVTPERASQFARRIATDHALGMDKRLDRKPFEYFTDASSEHDRGYITFGDKEYILLTPEEHDLERDLSDALHQIGAGMEEMSEMSAGAGDEIRRETVDKRKDQIKDERDRILEEVDEDISHLIPENIPQSFDPDLFKDERLLGPEWV
ncbi:MAG: hypothetical protein ABEJ75_04565 [Candidatus Nanohaloarchaea archaeon]